MQCGLMTMTQTWSKECCSTFTPSNIQTASMAKATIQQDGLYHCDTLEGKVSGTMKWWLRHVLMCKIADKYVKPQLKASVRNEIFI